jgi:hypothetical protein
MVFFRILRDTADKPTEHNSTTGLGRTSTLSPFVLDRGPSLFGLDRELGPFGLDGTPSPAMLITRTLPWRYQKDN